MLVTPTIVDPVEDHEAMRRNQEVISHRNPAPVADFDDIPDKAGAQG